MSLQHYAIEMTNMRFGETYQIVSIIVKLNLLDGRFFELQAQGGLKDINSVQKYAHLNSYLSKSAAEKMRSKIYGNG